MFVASCASTKVKSVWRASDVPEVKYRKIMIVGVDNRETVRQEFEDAFTAQLVREGIPAVASYSQFTLDELEQEQDAIAAKVREMGFDAVLITRLIDRQAVERYYQPPRNAPSDFRYGSGVNFGAGMYDPSDAYRSWTGYYSLGYRESARGVMEVVGEQVRLETNLYDVAMGELRWTALSETFVESTASRQKDIQSIVTAMVKKLKKEKFIP